MKVLLFVALFALVAAPAHGRQQVTERASPRLFVFPETSRVEPRVSVAFLQEEDETRSAWYPLGGALLGAGAATVVQVRRCSDCMVINPLPTIMGAVVGFVGGIAVYERSGTASVVMAVALFAGLAEVGDDSSGAALPTSRHERLVTARHTHLADGPPGAAR